MTRNADVLDNAADLTRRENDAVVARRRAEYASREPNPRGLCRDCDEPINPRRMAADPCAARCVSCQQDADLRESHRRRF